jgi:hypothetical protein
MANAAKHSEPSGKNETSEYATFEKRAEKSPVCSTLPKKFKFNAEKRKKIKKSSASPKR